MSKAPSKLRLKIANSCTDVLDRAKISTTNEKNFKFHFVTSDQLSESWKQILMALLELNMRALYEKSNWGWKYEEKLSEISKSTTRLILVTEANSLGDCNVSNKLPDEEEAKGFVGFMSYRFEIGADKSECALYVYEIHLAQEYQGKGLGKELMRIAKTLAFNFKMDKIMLTVFNYNKQALQFYNKLHFTKDKSCPSKLEADYVILSHKIKL